MWSQIFISCWFLISVFLHCIYIGYRFNLLSQVSLLWTQFFFIDLGALIFVVVMCSACLISFFLRRIWFLAVVFICRYKWNRGNGLLTIVSVLLINATRTHHHHHCQCRAFKLWKWQFTIWSKTVNTKVTTNDRCWPISTTVTDWMSKGQLIACMKQTDRDRMNAWRVREKTNQKSSNKLFIKCFPYQCRIPLPMCKCVTRWFAYDFVFRMLPHRLPLNVSNHVRI